MRWSPWCQGVHGAGGSPAKRTGAGRCLPCTSACLPPPSASPRRAAASSSGSTSVGASRAFTGPAEWPSAPGQVGAAPSWGPPSHPAAPAGAAGALGYPTGGFWGPHLPPAPSPGVAGSAVPADGGPRLSCWPCREGCASCVDDTPCLIQEDRALRAAILSCQASCMLAVFLSMLVSYHFRRSKASAARAAPGPPAAAPLAPCPPTWLPPDGGLSREGVPGWVSLPWAPSLPAPLGSRLCPHVALSPQRIRASGVVLLETILFGSLLLYFPVSTQPRTEPPPPCSERARAGGPMAPR